MKKNSYQGSIIVRLVSFFLMLISLSACYDHNMVIYTEYYDQIEKQIWQDPEHAQVVLEALPMEDVSIEENMYRDLLNELVGSRLGNPGSPDSVMQQVINYFGGQKHHKQILAKAYYVQGVERMMQTRYFEALQSFKDAEQLANYLPDNLPYKFLIYLSEGRIAETEYLLHISQECFLQALNYALILNDKYRTACVYNDIARTRDTYNDSISSYYYNEALSIANELHDTILYYDILIQKELHNRPIDSLALYQYAKLLSDSCGHPLYAHIVVEYLQNHGQMDEAKEYLDFCAQDTSHSAWSKEHFHYLLSRQLYLTDQPKQAFHLLETLYLDQTEQIFRDGKAKTYTISRMYDLEQEKNSNLQLRMEKQHLWITLGVILSVLAFVILTIFYLLRLQKQRTRAHAQALEIERLQAQAAEAQAKMEIERLNVELEVKRLILLESLQQRVKLSKDIAQSSEGISDKYPQWLKEWLEENTFTQGVNVGRLIREFNLIYAHLLTNLKKRHSDLTEKDLQYIALAVLGLNINDICFILGASERTIWNRRQAIKNRLGDSKLDLDEWIKSHRRVSTSA